MFSADSYRPVVRPSSRLVPPVSLVPTTSLCLRLRLLPTPAVQKARRVLLQWLACMPAYVRPANVRGASHKHLSRIHIFSLLAPVGHERIIVLVVSYHEHTCALCRLLMHQARILGLERITGVWSAQIEYCHRVFYFICLAKPRLLQSGCRVSN